MKIYGRNEETQTLANFLNSSKAEFLAIYGRRRVGKTYLIKNFFSKENCVFFSVTGIQDGTFKEQRTEFCNQISKVFYDGVSLEVPKDWFKVLELLNKAVDNMSNHTKKVVLFFDEFPWLVTPKSRLLQALEFYWNQYWSHDTRIKLIVCGSLASWIIKNIIENTGGLYKRVTYRLEMDPFNLNKTRSFLKNRGIDLTNKHILSLYMVIGGIPFYLEQVNKGITANQAIDQICFQKNGFLVDELDELFKSLFNQSTIYIQISREISKYRYGMSKSELAKKLRLSQSGRLVERLKELEDAGFVISFLPYHHLEKGEYYRIIDEYTLFYFRWIASNIRSIRRFSKPSGYWMEQFKKSSYISWQGYTFESICYKHIPQIINKLKLKPSAVPYSWRYAPKKGLHENGAQIDLLFDRDDDAITICEIKHTDKPFVIDKDYAQRLKQKIDIFKKITRTSKQIFIAFISSSGLKKTIYSEEMVSEIVTLDDLFKDIK